MKNISKHQANSDMTLEYKGLYLQLEFDCILTLEKLGDDIDEPELYYYDNCEVLEWNIEGLNDWVDEFDDIVDEMLKNYIAVNWQELFEISIEV